MTRPFRDGEFCIECGTNERKHHAHGLCVNCYARIWRKDNPDTVKKIQDKHNKSKKRQEWLEDYYKTDEHKNSMLKRSKKYRENNSEIMQERTRIWRKKNPEIIEAYKVTAKNKKIIRKYGEDALKLMKETDYKCQKCGGIKRVAVHHIDWNDKNNVYENFAILCGSCHSSLHSWQPPELRREIFEDWMNQKT